MKVSSIQTKELALLESMMSGSDRDTRRYLRNMHENFVVPYINYLNKVKTRLDEAELTSDQITQLFQQSAQGAQASGDNSTMLGKMLPDSIKQKFADSLPAADAGEVPGFDQKAQAAVAQVQDPTTKQSLMGLIKQGLQNPVTQKLILTAVSGIAGVAASAVTGGLGGKVGSTAAGALTGGLMGVVTAKMQGADWKTAGKAGLKGAAMGGAAGLVGGMAASMGQQAMSALSSGGQETQPGAQVTVGDKLPDGSEVTGLDSGKPGGEVTITSPDGKEMKVGREEYHSMSGQQGITPPAQGGVTQGASSDPGAGVTDAPSGITARPTGLQPLNNLDGSERPGAAAANAAASGGISSFNAGIAPIGPDGTPMKEVPFEPEDAGATAGGVPIASAEPGINRLTGKPIAEPTHRDNMTPDQQAATLAKQQQQAADSAAGEENAKEYWANKPSNTRSLRKESIDRDLTVRVWALNESLGKPRGGVHLTEAGVGSIVSGIGKWLKTKGQNLTQTVTADKLQQAWTKAGKPTDSAKVAELLKQQGISDAIIASAYSAMGIPQDAPANAAAGEKIEPTMDPQEPTPATAEPEAATAPAAQPEPEKAAATAPGAEPAATAGTSIFADPKKLAYDFESYMADGGKIPPAMRGVLKDILLTALRTVENKQRKLNAIIKESKRLQKQVVELKKRKQV